MDSKNSMDAYMDTVSYPLRLLLIFLGIGILLDLAGVLRKQGKVITFLSSQVLSIDMEEGFMKSILQITTNKKYRFKYTQNSRLQAMVALSKQKVQETTPVSEEIKNLENNLSENSELLKKYEDQIKFLKFEPKKCTLCKGPADTSYPNVLFEKTEVGIKDDKQLEYSYKKIRDYHVFVCPECISGEKRKSRLKGIALVLGSALFMYLIILLMINVNIRVDIIEYILGIGLIFLFTMFCLGFYVIFQSIKKNTQPSIVLDYLNKRISHNEQLEFKVNEKN